MTYHNGKIYVGITNYNPIDYTYGQGRVAIIDANSRTLEDSIEVSTNPGIIFVDLQEEVNVVCTGDYFSVFGEVWRIDPQSGAVIGHFTLGGMPISERLSVEGKVFLAGGGDWATQGFLLEYDAQTETVLHGGDNPIVIPDKSSIMDVALDSQGRIYLASFSSDEILQLDPVSFAITNSYKVGDGPQKMVLVNI
jgi:DNA-binding beta-propeller fold protein YncE